VVEVTSDATQAEIGLAAVELLASRLCHDLVGPVGAIGNGLELLAEESSRFAGETVTLVTRSAERTAAMLALFRAAFGASGGQAGFGLGEAQRVMADVLAGGKAVLDWPEEAQAGPLGAAKLLLVMILVAGETLPRGGRIAVRTSQNRDFAATVTATGVGARLTPELRAALDPAAALDSLTTRSIHAYFAAHLCRRQHAKLGVDSAPDAVTLTLRMPPQPGG
jgi:histidine phosphotransferase ChpT